MSEKKEPLERIADALEAIQRLLAELLSSRRMLR